LIKKVKLKNWRSHEDTELEFDRGINVIMGRMGSGKSSIMDAICFALFNTFPILQKKIIKLDDIIMRYPKEKKIASVDVWFEMNEKEYHVKRIIEKNKGTTTSELRENEKLLEGPKSNAVTKLIEKILGIDYELFSRAVYSEQNNIDYFLTLRPSDRKKKIDELLMIDKFEFLRSATVSILNKVKERMKNRLNDIENINEKELLKKKINIENEIKSIKNELKENEISIIKLKKKLEEDELKISEMEKIKMHLDDLNKNLALNKGQLLTLMSMIEKIKIKIKGQKIEDIEIKLDNLKNKQNDISKRKNEIETEIDLLLKSSDKIVNEIGRINSEMKTIEKNIREKKIYEDKVNEYKIMYNNLDALNNKINKKRNELEFLQIKLGSIKNEIDMYEDSIKKLQTSKNKCPVCGAELKEDKKNNLINEKKNKIKNLKEDIDNINTSMKNMKDEIDKLSKEKNIWEKINAKMETIKEVDKDKIKKELTILEDKKTKINSDIENLKKEKKSIEENYNLISNQLTDLKKIKDMFVELNENKIKYENLEKKIKIIESEIKSITFNEKEYQELKSELMKLSSKEGEINTSIQKDNEMLLDKNNLMVEISNQIKLLEKYKRDYKILKIMDMQLPKFKEAIEKTQIQLRNELIDLVNNNMSSIWKKFYPYEELEDIRLNTLSNDYKLELFNGSEWTPVEGIASGGERTAAAITLRIALSISLVKQLKWLILDEPTHNLDEVAIESFSFILREKLSSMVNQIFIITHEEKLETAVTGNFYKLKKEKGITKEFKEDVE